MQKKAQDFSNQQQFVSFPQLIGVPCKPDFVTLKWNRGSLHIIDDCKFSCSLSLFVINCLTFFSSSVLFLCCVFHRFGGPKRYLYSVSTAIMYRSILETNLIIYMVAWLHQYMYQFRHSLVTEFSYCDIDNCNKRA